MVAAAADGCESLILRRRRLAVAVVAPTNGSPVESQSAGIHAAAADGRESLILRRRRLTPHVGSPTDRSIGFETQRTDMSPAAAYSPENLVIGRILRAARPRQFQGFIAQRVDNPDVPRRTAKRLRGTIKTAVNYSAIRPVRLAPTHRLAVVGMQRASEIPAAADCFHSFHIEVRRRFAMRRRAASQARTGRARRATRARRYAAPSPRGRGQERRGQPGPGGPARRPAGRGAIIRRPPAMSGRCAIRAITAQAAPIAPPLR